MKTRSESINQDFARHRYICYAPTGWSPFLEQDEEDYQIREDLEVLREHWQGLITYGTMGCLAAIPRIAHELGFKRLILGIYDVTNEAEILTAFDLLRNYPELIQSVCLGNEGLSFKTYEVSDFVSCAERFRAEFPSLWITTSEPIFAWGDRALFENVDFCLPIIHPWIHEIFKTDPEMAAMWTIQAAQRLQILSEKTVLIKETGFPGDGDNYPYDLQKRFWGVMVKELGALTRDVYLAFFEAFDNPLKVHFSARTHWDCYWGLYTETREPKDVMSVVGPYLSGSSTNCEPAACANDVADVAVVITGKDRPHYMREAIESVFAQKGDVREIILVNDNSSDADVDALCRQYSDQPGVRYVKRSLPGSSGTARNAGLALVRSKYVCFLDDDDRFAPQKIRAQVREFEKNPNLAFVATGATVIGSEGTVYARSGSPDFFPGAPLASMLAFCRVIHSSVMMKTDVIREVGGYREAFQGEDWELWCRLLARGEEMHLLDSPLTEYRRHESNISSAKYLRAAVKNVFNSYSDLTSKQIIAPLTYQEKSGELVKAVLSAIHGRYQEALADIESLNHPLASLLRFICLREMGQYAKARAELGGWANEAGFSEEFDLRLRVHESKYAARLSDQQPMVGSPALLFEHRLLAQDALSAATRADHQIDLQRYFHAGPKNISIERNEENDAVKGDLFFRRVSLTSC